MADFFFFASVFNTLFRKCFIVIIMVNYQITFFKKSFSGAGGFLPAMKQIGNVAALPGIVHRSIGLPDVHSGYGFAIGNMAAFDMSDPEAVVSPGKDV